MNTSTSPTAASGLTTSSPSNTTAGSSETNLQPVKLSAWERINVFKKSKKSLSQKLDPNKKSNKKIPRTKMPDLDIVQVQDAAVAGEQQALRYQENLGVWRRARWAKRDQDDLKAAIAQLRHGNNNLESVVRLLAPTDSWLPLPRSDHAESLWPLVTRISKTLGFLNQELMILNVKKSNHDPYFLSLRLSEDHQKSRTELGDYVSLRDGSHVFNLQRQLADKTGETSDLLLIQSFQKRGESSEKVVPNRLPELKGMDRPDALEDPLDIDGIELWGSFGNAVEHDYLHIVYHDKDNEWKRTDTLADILTGTEFRDNITPVQVVQLAKILLCSYLYLGNIYGGTKVPRPSNYCFYKTSDEEDSWNYSEPRVLRPWLSFGFGRRPPKAKLGSGSGVADSTSSAMAELALLLYQIGTGLGIDYAVGAAGVSKAKAETLGNIHALDLRMGLVYAEIVQGLLEFEARPSYLLAPGDENQEMEYVKRAISALMKLEHDFVDTVTAPAVIQSTPMPDIQIKDVASVIVSTENLAPSFDATTPFPKSIATTV